jgi:FkbM family methyltransferase
VKIYKLLKAIGIFYYFCIMIKNTLRKIAQRYGYDFIKTLNFEFGKEFKKRSSEPKFDYYETIIGNYYLPKNCNGDAVANAMKTGKLFDAPIFDIAKQYIKSNTSILDIGANYGQMAIEFSKIAINTKVFAFEAQEMVFEVLEKNIASNNAKNVTTFFNAVFDTANIDLIFPEPDLIRFSSYGSYGLDLNAKAGKLVKSITIDSLIFEMPISFMKIDIQGSDLAAMRGSVNTIKEHKMPIIFEYEEQFRTEFNTSFQDYVDFVNSIDYRFEKTVQDINYLILPK